MARATVPTPRFEGVIHLADRRRISFAEYGSATGRPVFWFHGTPGARRQVPPAARAAALELDVRIIALDRPGVGGSTPHQYDNVLAHAHDVRDCADQLGVDRFATIGLSGGGAYALACASAMPDRVVSGAVLGGVAPGVGPERANGGIVTLAVQLQALTSRIQGALGAGLWLGLNTMKPARDLAFELYCHISPEGDERVLRSPGMKEFFLDDLFRGARRQYRAVPLDIVLFGRDWGFELRAIDVPIHFWHGDADHIIPLAHGEHMASLIPGADLRVRPAESHLSGLAICEEVLDVVLSDWPDERSGARDDEGTQLPSLS